MKKVILSILLLAVILAGCRGVSGTPPEIAVGTTTCSSCQRVIKNGRLASAARLPDGSVQTFDRTRCLLTTIPPDDKWNVWFQDREGSGWIEASNAFFLIQRTGAGGSVTAINAFVDRDHAKAFYERTPGRNELVPDFDILRGVASIR